MKHPKISIASSAVATSILAAITVLFLSFNTPVGYGAGVMFFLLTLLWTHRLYTKLWLYNWGKPLSEDKKLRRQQLRHQVRNYKRYNLYHVWYRFADATEDEYQAEKAREQLKKLKRK